MNKPGIRFAPLALFLSTIVLSSCASQGNYATRTVIPPDSEIRAQVINYSQDSPNVESQGEAALGTAGEGAAIGAGAGLYGGVQAGLACGPLFFLCSPVLGAGMAVVGGVGGAAVGAVVGAYRGLPKETADLLEIEISEYVDSADFVSDFDTAFVTAVGQKWNLTEDAADSNIDLSIYYLGTEPVNDESVVFVLGLGLQIRQGSSPRSPTKTFLFDDRQTLFVEDMLANDGDIIRTSLQSAFFRLTNQMVMLLELP